MAKKYTIQELENRLTKGKCFLIKRLYRYNLKSQREIAKELDLSRMFVAEYIRLSGLSRNPGEDGKRLVKQTKEARVRQKRIGFAIKGMSPKMRQVFLEDLRDASRRRKSGLDI